MNRIKWIAFTVLIITTFLMLGAEPPITEDVVDTYDNTMNTLGKVWLVSLFTVIIMRTMEVIVYKRLKQIK